MVRRWYQSAGEMWTILSWLANVIQNMSMAWKDPDPAWGQISATSFQWACHLSSCWPFSQTPRPRSSWPPNQSALKTKCPTTVHCMYHKVASGHCNNHRCAVLFCRSSTLWLFTSSFQLASCSFDTTLRYLEYLALPRGTLYSTVLSSETTVAGGRVSLTKGNKMWAQIRS